MTGRLYMTASDGLTRERVIGYVSENADWVYGELGRAGISPEESFDALEKCAVSRGINVVRREIGGVMTEVRLVRNSRLESIRPEWTEPSILTVEMDPWTSESAVMKWLDRKGEWIAGSRPSEQGSLSARNETSETPERKESPIVSDEELESLYRKFCGEWAQCVMIRTLKSDWRELLREDHKDQFWYGSKKEAVLLKMPWGRHRVVLEYLDTEETPDGELDNVTGVFRFTVPKGMTRSRAIEILQEERTINFMRSNLDLQGITVQDSSDSVSPRPLPDKMWAFEYDLADLKVAVLVSRDARLRRSLYSVNGMARTIMLWLGPFSPEDTPRKWLKRKERHLRSMFPDIPELPELKAMLIDARSRFSSREEFYLATGTVMGRLKKKVSEGS